MATLPASTDYTGSSVTQGGKKTFIAALRSYLAAALGTDSDIIAMPGTASVAGLFSAGTATVSTYHRVEKSNANDIAMRLKNGNATNPSGLYILHDGVAGNTGGYFIQTSDSVATNFRVRNDGNVQNTNNSYGAISDPRLKQDVRLASSQWDDVKALAQRVVKYRLKSNPDGPFHIGFLSRDDGGIPGVRSVCPGLVFEVQEQEEVDSLDESGRKVSERRATGVITEGVQYSIAQMKAFKALGEALERIEALESEVLALKAKP